MNNELIEIIRIIGSMDFECLVQCFMPLISFCVTRYVTNKAISTYTLNKDFKPKDISKVSVPPELTKKYENIDVSHIASKKIRNATLEFANLLLEKFPPNVLINFYNNINEVKINRNLRIIMSCASGTYYTKNNEIDIAFLSSIYHELFHMASAYYDKENKISYSGFRQYPFDSKSDSPRIGVGINEGYTELLTERYFGEKHKLPKTYKYEVSVVERLEKIIGQDNMESLYLNANLPGLIDELKRYASEDDISKFISSVDLISKRSHDIFIFKNKKIDESAKFVIEFLFNTYVIKLKQQLNDGIIDKREFIQQIKEFSDSLSNKVTIGLHNYKLYEKEKLLEIMSKVADFSELTTNGRNDKTSIKQVTTKQGKAFSYSDILLFSKVNNSIVAIVNDKEQFERFSRTNKNDDLPIAVLPYSDEAFETLVYSMKKIRGYIELDSKNIKVEYDDGDSMVFDSENKAIIENIIIEQRKALIDKTSKNLDNPEINPNEIMDKSLNGIDFSIENQGRNI